MRRAALALLAAVCLAQTTEASEGQAWLENALKVRIGSVWQFRASHEVRTRELDYNDTLLHNYAVGFTRTLPKSLSVGLFYKREKELGRPDGTLTEDRPYVDIGWKRSLRPKIGFESRLRTELRRFRRNAKNDVVRFRIRLGLRSSLALGPTLEAEPFIWTEIFTGHEQPLRNRLSAGVLLKLTRNVGFELSYVRQDTRGREALNVLKTGLHFSF